MTRKPSKQPLAILVIILLAIGLLFLGTYFGLFAVFKPKPEPATWPKIVSLHIGQYYERIGFFGAPVDSLLGEVNDDYQILTYSHELKGWQRLDPPVKTITVQRPTYGPWPKQVKPSIWQYEESGDTVYFRIDPDEEDDGMPDLAIAIKFVRVQAFADYAVALYEVHVAIIGTSAREIPRLYKDTYFTVAFDSWYLLTGIRLNDKEQKTLIDDRSGKSKVMIWVPEVTPQREAGDVWVWEYLLKLPVDSKMYEEVTALDIEYDPTVVVTSAKTTYHFTAESHTGPTLTTYQTTGTQLATTAVHHTVIIPVTTTETITTYQVVYETTTVGGKTVTITTSTTVTRRATRTGLMTTTTTLREGETVTIIITSKITKTKVVITKIIEELEKIPWWVWAICIALFAGLLFTIGYAGRVKSKTSKRRTRRKRR